MIDERAPGQVWQMKDNRPGVFLIIGPGETSYGDGWDVLVLESQEGRPGEEGMRVFDDVWFALGFSERIV